MWKASLKKANNKSCTLLIYNANLQDGFRQSSSNGSPIPTMTHQNAQKLGRLDKLAFENLQVLENSLKQNVPAAQALKFKKLHEGNTNPELAAHLRKQ